MVKPQRRIVWDLTAKEYLQEALQFIARDSVQNAEKVRTQIPASVIELLAYPEKHATDKYRLHNEGHYRAFELHHFRISYYVSVNEIRIVRVRHTSQNPQTY